MACRNLVGLFSKPGTWLACSVKLEGWFLFQFFKAYGVSYLIKLAPLATVFLSLKEAHIIANAKEDVMDCSRDIKSILNFILVSKMHAQTKAVMIMPDILQRQANVTKSVFNRELLLINDPSVQRACGTLMYGNRCCPVVHIFHFYLHA